MSGMIELSSASGHLESELNDSCVSDVFSAPTSNIISKTASASAVSSDLTSGMTSSSSAFGYYFYVVKFVILLIPDFGE